MSSMSHAINLRIGYDIPIHFLKFVPFERASFCVDADKLVKAASVISTLSNRIGLIIGLSLVVSGDGAKKS